MTDDSKEKKEERLISYPSSNQENDRKDGEPSLIGSTRIDSTRVDSTEEDLLTEGLLEEEADKPKSNSIYILPNLFTTGALLSGFSSILLALDGSYARAAMMVFVAMVLDGLDGRIARWTNSSSSFGEQYDSLSDLISFGVAPAVLIYEWSLKSLMNEATIKIVANFSWFAVYLYVACTALRLARFNVQIGNVDKKYFQGMPSPTAAAILVGLVWFSRTIDVAGSTMEYVALFLTVYTALMMVSNVRFYSFKTFNVRKTVTFYSLLLVVFYSGLLLSSPAKVIFFTMLIYGFSGPALYLWQLKK